MHYWQCAAWQARLDSKFVLIAFLESRIDLQAIVSQHQAQVLLRHSWQGLLHCCCGLQYFIRDIVDLLPAQLWVDAACK